MPADRGSASSSDNFSYESLFDQFTKRKRSAVLAPQSQLPERLSNCSCFHFERLNDLKGPQALCSTKGRPCRREEPGNGGAGVPIVNGASLESYSRSSAQEPVRGWEVRE